MTVFNVSSVAELSAIFWSAGDGDTIAFAPGTYSGVTFSGVNKIGNVTITSSDPLNPAVFSDLKVSNSSGLTFTNLEFYDSKPSDLFGFTVSGSSNIVLTNLVIHGLDNVGTGLESGPLMIRDSTNVSMTNCEVYDVKFGLNILDNNGLTISNNFFHDLRTDGIRGGGNSNVVISENTFTNFYPADGDHPDAIQFWTTNETTSAYNIVVDDNLIVRGDGAAVQGIFFRDQVGNLPYYNVSITNNTVLGGLYNGICPYGISTGLIASNTVIGYTDQRSWIDVIQSVGLSYANNIATFYLQVNGSSVITGLNGNTLSTLLLGLDGQSVSSSSSLLMTSAMTTASSTAISDQTFINTWLLTHPTTLFADGAMYDDLRATFGVVQTATQMTVGTTSFALVTGTDAADNLTAKTGIFSVVHGGFGNDTLNSVTSSSGYLAGGMGDDTYVVRNSNTYVLENLAEGTDTVSAYVSYTLTDNVENLRLMGTVGLTGTGNALANQIIGTAANDTIYGLGGDDYLRGGAGNDVLYGGDGNDEIRGEAGNDTIYGGNGDNKLIGGDGNDVIVGGDGNDTIEGNTGADTMTGGLGNDTYVFRQDDLATYTVDTITDFLRGSDRLGLNLIDSNINTTSVNDAFSFIGTASFHHVAGELRYVVQGADSYVYGDVNGDGVADFGILLKGVTSLTANDFIL